MDRKQVKAFEAFVGEAGDALFRIAILLTSNRAEAEDLYQDAMQRLASRWSRVESAMAFSRKGDAQPGDRRAPARRAPAAPGAPERRPRSGRRPGGRFARSGRAARPLLRALDTLTTQQRTVVVLRYFEDLTRPTSPRCSRSHRGLSRPPPPALWPACEAIPNSFNFSATTPRRSEDSRCFSMKTYAT